MFGSLDEPQLLVLAGVATTRHYRKGQPVFLEGDGADSIFVVAAGHLRVVSASPEGQELLLAVLGPLETFGELAIADDGARSASVFAQTQTALLRLPVDEVRRCSEESPEILRVVLILLAGVVRRLTGTAADLVFLDLPRRVTKYLLHRSQGNGTDVVHLQLTQGELAQHLGSSRQSINATLGALERRGWIQARGQHITIRDAAALSRFLGD